MGVHALARKFLPDFIYGAHDGVVTTLAVVSGVVGASLSSTVILVLGFANLLADGFSMGASNVLSRRSEMPLPPLSSSARHGLATFIGFLFAGFVPLIAYVVPVVEAHRFQTAVAMALVTLFAVGAGRAFFTNRGALRAGLEMLLIGAVASGIAYLIGVIAGRLVGTVD